MLLVYAVIAAVIIGYLLGGRLKNYPERPLKLVLLPCFAFMIEACFGLMYQFVDLPPEKWLGWAVCAEYALLALFVIFNFRRRGMKLLGVSALANFTVIAANGFRMPVSPLVYQYPKMAEFVTRIQSGELMEYVLVDWNGPLWFMGDTIPMFGGLASAGDLIMAAAVLIIILDIMDCAKLKKHRSSAT